MRAIRHELEKGLYWDYFTLVHLTSYTVYVLIFRDVFIVTTFVTYVLMFLEIPQN